MLNQLSYVIKRIKKVLILCQKGTANWNQQLSTQDIIEYTKRAASAIIEDEM